MANTIEISTDSVAPEGRFEFVREFCKTWMGVTHEPILDPSLPYVATCTWRTHGYLQSYFVDADPSKIGRHRHEISAVPLESYVIRCEMGEGEWIGFNDGGFRTRRGTLIVYDGDQPLDARPAARSQLNILRIPKALLDPHLPKQGKPLLKTLSDKSGASALAASYLETLHRQWDNIDAADIHGVTDTLCRLIAVSCGSTAETTLTALRAGRLTAAKRIIELHLADASLSAATVAAQLRISVRSLHALFQTTGTNFTDYLRSRRLEACKATLLADTTRSVTDIAFAWGFGSIPSFYRAFQAAFGMAPGDLREIARAQGRKRADQNQS